jgi:membrane protein required for colicin V production
MRIVQAYDLIMLIVLGMATIFGAIKGFAWQVASLASIVVSYIVAYRYRFDVAEMIEAKPPWNQFLAMLILYIGTSFVIWVGFRLTSGMIDKVRLKEFDRHLGAAFGLAKGVIFCLLITMFAMSLLGPQQQAAICQSKSGYFIATALDRGVGILPQEIHDVVGPYLANLDDKLRRGGADIEERLFDDSNGPASGLTIPGWHGELAFPAAGNQAVPPAGGLPWPVNRNGQSGQWDWQQSMEAISGANHAARQFNDAFDSLGREAAAPQNFPPLNSAPAFDAGSNGGLRPSSGLRPSNPGDVNTLPGSGFQQAQQPGIAPPFPRY